MREELQFSMTESMEREARSVLFPETPLMPEHGFIGVLRTSTGRRRRTLLLQSIVPQHEGDVVWRQGLRFSTAYKSRALDALAGKEAAGLVFVHTHPSDEQSGWPHPSREDLKADRDDLYFLGLSLAPGAPLAAAIVGSNGKWSIREYHFEFPSSGAEARRAGADARLRRLTYATRVRIVGPGVRTLSMEPEELDSEGISSLQQVDSSVRLWGQVGQIRLSKLRVGLTGLGGVGGILAEHLARLGVGELVLVDYDRLQIDNFNRSQGALRSEAKSSELKVVVASRVATDSATASSFSITALRKSVVEADCIPDLLDCDIILNGADSAWARQVLDNVAFAHLIPVINGGTTLVAGKKSEVLIAGKSEVTATGPGHVCMECAGSYSRADVTDTQAPPSLRGDRAYIANAAHEPAPRAPSVISNNALTAALMELRFQAIVLRTAPATMVGTQRFHVLEGIVEWAERRVCKDDCTLAHVAGDGDAHAIPVGTDLDFREMREREDTSTPSSSPPKTLVQKLIELALGVLNRP